jgi:membrane-bound lytic murein transglycosylase D
MFNDWSLAIAAYNCGPYNVQKALLRAGGSKSLTFWDVYNYLPQETRGYVPAFIAATYIMNFYCEHGITPMDAVLPAESDTIVVAHDAKLVNIASICNVTIDELRSLNPQYRRDIVPQNYAVRLPAQAIESFITKEDLIYGARITSTANNDNTSSSENENAENSNVSVMPLNTSELASSDNADSSDSTVSVVNAATNNNSSWYSQSGRQNSRNTQSSRYSRRNSRSSRQNTTKSVSVRSGDTLSKIAAQNGTTVEKLRRMNGIKGSTIRPGQKIRVK